MRPFPGNRPQEFRATLHGTCFGDRPRLLRNLTPRCPVALVPDPPVQDDPQVWLHEAHGRPLGHLPPEIGAWLAPWMQKGGRASAHVIRVHGDEVPSWRRVLVKVQCGDSEARSSASGD